MLRIAIVGRPNVGKSTLFNRLTGKKLALVDPTPGLTRDRKEETGTIADLQFLLIDTAGLEKAENDSLEALMMRQTDAAIEEADILFMMIDGREGVTPMDEYFGHNIRRVNKPTILIANKCEGRKASPGLSEAFRLGLGEPVAISAEHGDGLVDLYDAVHAMAEALGIPVEEEEESKPDMHIAIAGRPNVGKSTFFNALLGEERSIASDVAGTTRDSVYVDWEYKGQQVKLVDTAGLRKRAKRHERLEKMSVNESFRAIQYANVVIMMIDGTDPMNKMDLTLADHIIKEGRGMVLAVNKWDSVEDKAKAMATIEDALEFSLTQAKGVPVVTLSALKGRNIHKVMQAACNVYALWNQRVSTGKLNRWLEAATSAHIPPLSQGKRIRLRYATQIKTRPPTFAVFSTSNVKDLPDSYIRYLSNSLREAFGFGGVPMRVLIRKQKNPYDKKG